MAFTIVTPATIIARNAGALYNFKAGAVTMASLVDQYNATTGGDALLNRVYVNSIGAAPTTEVASVLVTNLGITDAAAVTAASDFIVGMLNAAAPEARGAVVNQVLSLFAGATADPTFGAAATAWNAKVDAAVTYSGAAANADTAFSPIAPTVPTTFTLTTGVDDITGGTGDDLFNAWILNNANTLQSGDRLDGGAGTDALWADMGSSGAFAVTPHLTSIEKVSIRAQSVQSDPQGGGNNGNNTINQGDGVVVDAQRSSSVTTWESSNSRTDVIVEDVRTNSNVTTVSFVESDPGNVDLGVYFNERNLVNTSGGTSSLDVYLMDVTATGTPATAATPLLNMTFNTFSFYNNDELVILGGKDTAAGDAIQASKTYAALQDAFELALTTANIGGTVAGGFVTPGTGTIVDLSAVVTVTLGPLTNFTATAIAAGVPAATADAFLSLSGQVLTLKADATSTVSSSNTAGATAGWQSSGNTPLTGALVQAFTTGATSSTVLVSTSIILDDVGLGDMGGDLVVGGMSTGLTSNDKGVERFNIEVRDNSQLQTINSTNNTLREVVITNGATTSTSTAYVTTTKDAGKLTVGGTNTFGTVDTGLPGTAAVAGTNQTFNHSAAGSAGFIDVRLIDASAMRGDFSFTAAVTTDSIKKYMDLVDTAASPAADVATDNVKGLGANFVYTGGTGNDSMVVALDALAAASRSTIISGQSDFTFTVNGGSGDDKITVNVANPTGLPGAPQNWYNNQNLNDNITITGGDGNDTIRTPGAGDTKIDAGAGDDVIYTDNSGVQARTVLAGAASTLVNGYAVWVFNTSDQVNAAPTLAARDLYDLRSDVNDSYNLFNADVTVSFRGLPSAKIKLANGTTYKATDLEINQAIKNAINNDATLKTLLLAQDGPANSLVVTSLTDGARVAGDLSVTITVPTVALAGTDLTGAAAAYSLAAGSTSAQVIAAMTTSLGAWTTKGDYVAALATDQAGLALTGVASTNSSDNFVTPGTGNDVIVLGTEVGAAVDTSSNDVVVLTAGFGNDVVVNFDAAGPGVDHISLAAFLGGVPAGVVTALAGTNRNVTVVAETTANDTPAEIKALVDALGVVTAQKQVFIAYNTNNVGKVYSIVDGTAAADSVVTLEGSVDLADTGWAGLTVANFTVPTAIAEGLTGVVPPVPAGPTISVAGAAAVNEGASATFTATLSAAQATATTVTYTLAGTGGAVLGTDTGVNVPAGNTGTLTFAAGATTATVVVPFATDAATPEAGEGVSITLSAPSAGVTLGTAAATTTITDIVPGGAIATAVNAAGTSDASAGDVTFTVAAVASTYTFTIANFATGDVLDFTANGTLPSIIADADQTDGVQSFALNAPGGVATITLTGLTAAQDAAIFNVPSFNTVFGAGSMI